MCFWFLNNSVSMPDIAFSRKEPQRLAKTRESRMDTDDEGFHREARAHPPRRCAWSGRCRNGRWARSCEVEARVVRHLKVETVGAGFSPRNIQRTELIA